MSFSIKESDELAKLAVILSKNVRGPDNIEPMRVEDFVKPDASKFIEKKMEELHEYFTRNINCYLDIGKNLKHPVPNNFPPILKALVFSGIESGCESKFFSLIPAEERSEFFDCFIAFCIANEDKLLFKSDIVRKIDAIPDESLRKLNVHTIFDRFYITKDRYRRCFNSEYFSIVKDRCFEVRLNTFSFMYEIDKKVFKKVDIFTFLSFVREDIDMRGCYIIKQFSLSFPKENVFPDNIKVRLMTYYFKEKNVENFKDIFSAIFRFLILQNDKTSARVMAEFFCLKFPLDFIRIVSRDDVSSQKYYDMMKIFVKNLGKIKKKVIVRNIAETLLFSSINFSQEKNNFLVFFLTKLI